MNLKISLFRFVALAVVLLITVSAVIIKNSQQTTVKVVTEANDPAIGTLRQLAEIKEELISTNSLDSPG